MLLSSIRRCVTTIASCGVFLLALSTQAQAESAKELQTSARQALQSLYKTSPGTAGLGKRVFMLLSSPSKD